MNKPFISVVIPAYNEENFIGQTLASLRQQTYKGGFEIIVVDNNSTDKTAAIAKAYGARVIKEPRKGVHFARQTGFERAKGEFIASTDADNILPPQWLSQLSTKLKRKQKLVAVGGWFRIEKGPLYLRLLINYLSTPTLLLFKYLGLKQALIGQNFMVKKSAFSTVGGFNKYSAMNEDLELAKRLATVGEVQLYYGAKWAVVTSPRRWKHGFVAGSLRYLINAICFAIFGKLVFRSFKDIRDEEMRLVSSRKLGTAIATTAVFVVIFFATPIPAVQAKFDPIAEKAKKTVRTSVHYVQKPVPIKKVIEPIKKKF